MANTFSALKRVRQTEKRTTSNRAHISRFRTALRRFHQVLAAGNKQEAQARYRETVSLIDKAVGKGVIHRNAAARYKSRLAARVSGLR